MTQEEFVRNTKIAVLNNVVEETLATLLDPPGRRPDRTNDATARWYSALPEEGREYARIFARLVADSVVFGVFAVLDGARAIEDGGPKGELQLLFVKDGEVVRLNDPKGEELHSVFNGLEG